VLVFNPSALEVKFVGSCVFVC